MRRRPPAHTSRPTRPGPQWLDPMPARDWMKRDPIVIRDDAPIAVAAHRLRTHGIRHLPVVDAAGRLVGIATDRDLRQVIFDPMIQEALGDATLTLRALKVREIMTWGVVSVRPDTDLRAAARLMRERKIGALPVTEDGRVVGMLSELDVLTAFEKIMGSRLMTMRPLDTAAGQGEPYDYGLPAPAGADTDANHGSVD
jgi:acetoin utilization protein AcuB